MGKKEAAAKKAMTVEPKELEYFMQIARRVPEHYTITDLVWIIHAKAVLRAVRLKQDLPGADFWATYNRQIISIIDELLERDRKCTETLTQIAIALGRR
ncbi:MAG: hypothetical protein DRJ69_01725 [Thermoprotei archaeon]|nr:MAG: hypothetical protein DRJ69_01725 [Thermoprotei archaeon]